MEPAGGRGICDCDSCCDDVTLSGGSVSLRKSIGSKDGSVKFGALVIGSAGERALVVGGCEVIGLEILGDIR